MSDRTPTRWHTMETNVAVKSARDLAFGRVTAIALDGLKVVLDRRLRRGERVDVKLAVPGSQARVLATAVVRIQVTDDDGDVEVQLDFADLPLDSKGAIEKHIEREEGASELPRTRRRTNPSMVAAARAGREPTPMPELERPAPTQPPPRTPPPPATPRPAPPSRPVTAERGPSRVGSDRRSERRVAVTIPVAVAFQGQVEQTTCSDLSRRGMFLKLASPTRFVTDAPLSLQIQGMGDPIQVEARVARAVAEGFRAGVGVQFVDATDDASIRLSQLLKMLGL